MNGDPLRALIVDDNDGRCTGIRTLLFKEKVEAIIVRQVVHESGVGCCADNLMDCTDRIKKADILFMHLGPIYDQTRKRSSGNECSMEFYLAHRHLLDRVCVVAYSGGSVRTPKPFEEHHVPGWHTFRGGVMNPDTFNFKPFFRRFRRYRAFPPPLSWLTSTISLSTEFRSAIRNTLNGRIWLPPSYLETDSHVATSRDLLHRCARLLDGDPDGECLLEELIEKPTLHAVGEALVKFMRAGDNESAFHSASQELDTALRKFKIENEVGPSVPSLAKDQKKRRDDEIRAWQHRRARLNHDWLRVSFLTFSQAWSKELDRPAMAFPAEVDWRSELLGWRKRRSALVVLLEDAERLFVTAAGDPHGVGASVVRIKGQIRSVDELISQLLDGAESDGAGDRLYRQLCEISEGLSAFPSSGQA